MAYEIIAERETETVRMLRNSSLMALAKAKVWADEGWTVTVIVDDGETSIVGGDLTPSLIAPRALPAITFEP